MFGFDNVKTVSVVVSDPGADAIIPVFKVPSRLTKIEILTAYAVCDTTISDGVGTAFTLRLLDYGSGGTAVAKAKIQSNAAKGAAKDQQQATNQALAVQQQANQPYMDLGRQAAQRLGQMSQNAQPYTQVFGNGAGAQSFGGPQMGQPPQGPPPGSLAGLGRPQPPPGMGQPPGPQGPPQGQQPMQGPPQGGGGMVRVQAPTGEVAMLPDGSPQLQMALQKGARRL